MQANAEEGAPEVPPSPCSDGNDERKVGPSSSFFLALCRPPTAQAYWNGYEPTEAAESETPVDTPVDIDPYVDPGLPDEKIEVVEVDFF